MAITTNHFISASLLLGLLITLSLDYTDAQIGVCYGRLGSALPSPKKVVSLYKKYNITKMRIYDPYHPTLQALSGSNIELTLGVPNIHLQSLSSSQANADTWVRDNILQYPNVKLTQVVAGNEVSPIIKGTSRFVPYVLPAMQNIHNAIVRAGLHHKIKVSTSIDTSVLERSYPPSEGVFKANVTPYLDPIIQFLMKTSSPLFVGVYPYFAYIADKKNINISYALLQPDGGIVLPDGTRYNNLFYAIVDAMYAALEKRVPLGTNADARKPSFIDVKASESGWPSSGGDKLLAAEGGGDAEGATNVRNAEIYIHNLIRIVKNGTPKRPDQPIETFIFAMFDENRKHGPERERHFGLFRPNRRPKYRVNFN